ncbi:MAG TPA: c-type cytochrome [Agriterribacter sp.]|nr:c-type cytochrome [Chitinophagaceae bacterium]HRP31522.1 c-type cytochrome [Agriterribacter sp.]
MKKTAAILSIVAAFYACSSGQTEPKKPISVNMNPQIGDALPKATVAAPAGGGAAAPAKDGKALIAGSDCLACHQETSKLVGPSYADVAKKYKAADIPHLVKKIIDGGSGAWGEIPMSPHPTVSPEDAEAMVKYILTIK